MHWQRFIGGTLLIAGTAIGAGMLAIPVVTAKAGFYPTLGLFIVVWALLWTTAWLFLDVTLSCPGEVNFIGMVQRTLGPIGSGICWVVYLLLLYSLTAAYIAGCSSFFLEWIHSMTTVQIPTWVAPLPCLGFFGIFVYLGTRSVDWLNRMLMIGLLVTYVLLILFLPSKVDGSFLLRMEPDVLWMSAPLIMTSFGFHIIIPTLSTYFNHHVKALRWALFVGSFLPLIVYTVWEGLVLGVVPLEFLQKAAAQGQPATIPLSLLIQAPWLSQAAGYFSFFAIITSFLGVSLSLSDFLAEGLHMHRYSLGREFACLCTFIPPLIFVYLYPKGFIQALQYAGVFVAILLCIFPALMAWKLPQYRTVQRKVLLGVVVVLGASVIGIDLLLDWF